MSNTHPRSAIAVTLFLSALLAPPFPHERGAHAQSAAPPTPQQQLARDIFRELIEINTTEPLGTTKAAEAVAARLKAAGFREEDVRVLGPNGRKQNLVARLRGRGAAKPILLLAHLDVVEAKKEDWSTDLDPFKFTERDGYFYGRGTSDIKEEAAELVANMIRLKREGFVPDRDIILALTADEEGGPDNGVDWLLKNRRDLVDAGYAINTDAGGGQIERGRHVRNAVQTSEKVYLTFALEVKNRGGHSSLPSKENAIYRLAEGLARLSKFDFPVRTNCVATQLQGGHAENALPQTARATVNCRLLPEDNAADVEKTLVRVLADE